MKTKIVYISGNELFDIADIRAAFEEVRNALGLDSETVLFGVPVDNEDAGLGTQTEQTIEEETPVIDSEEDVPEEIEEETNNDIIEETHEIISVTTNESNEEPTPKKRGRPRKVPFVEDEEEKNTTEEVTEDTSEKIIPILSVLSTEESKEEEEQIETPEEIDEITSDVSEAQDTDLESEPDLEKGMSRIPMIQFRLWMTFQ